MSDKSGVGTAGELLRIEGLTKTFGGEHALSDVDLEVRAGEVHGLLGENGSGKSTLIKTLAGFHAPDGGRLFMRGREVPLPLPAGQFRQLGIEFVHQDLTLIPSLSVYENLRLGSLSSRRALSRISWTAEKRLAQQMLTSYGIELDVSTPLEDLLPVERALVAIVRSVEDMQAALSASGLDAGLLCLDEPTAFLPRDQVDRLFELVDRVVAAGAGVILVSHDLDEVCRVTDRATVLRNGVNVGTVRTSSVDAAELARLIVGRDVGDLADKDGDRHCGEVAVSASGLSTGALSSVSLDVHQGEILGVTGLVGSGFEDVPYALFGAVPAQFRSLRVNGVEHSQRMTPALARRAGMALIPGNRQRDGSIGSLSLVENLMQLAVPRFTRHGAIDRSALRRTALDLMERYDVRPRRPDLLFQSFSGGNQQKAVMAKWLEELPSVLLLHEPSQGVDIGARLHILQLVKDAAKRGSAVVCASSDYEQLAMICHRVLVVSGGRVVCELTGREVTKENITEKCLLSVVPAHPALQR